MFASCRPAPIRRYYRKLTQTIIEGVTLKKIGRLFYPDYETKFEAHGDSILDLGKKDRRAAYKYVRRWRRALDVGANAGIFSRAFAKRFDEVIAFEPMPLTSKCLAANVQPNVRVEGCAISDENGTLRMYQTGSCGASFVLDHPDVAVPEKPFAPHRIIKVPARTIDSFDFDAVDLIKLDIQGAEYPALAGARETILRHRPVILVEEKAASVEKVGADVHEAWLETIAKTADLLRSWGMTAKEKAKNDRVYVFEG